MEKVKAAATPGVGHAALENYVGDWKAEVTCFPPDESPQTTLATAKGTWIMGGLFLQEDFQGEMMGKPFFGRTLIGYDNVAHLFKSVWISDAQSSMFYTEGEGQDDNRVITLEGTSSCPMRDRADIPMRLVVRVYNPDKRSLEMFDLSNGEERKTMEIQYFRT